MNVSDITMSNYIPYLDFLFYKNKNDETYVEYADIDENQIIGIHKPLSHIDFANLVKTIKVSQKESINGFKSLIPKNVLFYRTDTVNPCLAWIVKGCYRDIDFKGKKGKLNFPHLLFIEHNNIFKVFSVKTLNIKEDTPLYRPPFPNMYDDFTMCWGTMNKQKFMTGDYTKLMKNFEAVFFNSRFTGELMNNSQSNVNYLKWLKGDMNKKSKSFDKNILVKTKFKAKDVILT